MITQKEIQEYIQLKKEERKCRRKINKIKRYFLSQGTCETGQYAIDITESYDYKESIFRPEFKLSFHGNYNSYLADSYKKFRKITLKLKRNES